METHDGFSVDEWQALAAAYTSGVDLRRDPRMTVLRDHQQRLQERAIKKFEDADRWLWTSKLLEQASDGDSAAMTAAFYPEGVHVIDFCCGAGADTVALARRGPVTAVDRCLVACCLAEANLAVHVPTLSGRDSNPSQVIDHSNASQVVCTDAERFPWDPNDWLHIDPDRRTSSKRTTRLQQFQPGPAFLAKAIEQSAGGSIKLAPATNLDSLQDSLDDADRDRMLSASKRVGRQWIEHDHSVRQQRWWWNHPAFPAASTTVSVAGRNGAWSHWTKRDDEAFHARHHAAVTDTWEAIGGAIGDTRRCVRAADLQATMACELGASTIGNSQGFLLRETLPTEPSPWIDWFRVVAVMPLDRKRLRTALRERNVGRLEIKVRSVEVDPESLRREMKLRGSESATLLITRCGNRTIAVIADRH